MLKRKRLYAIIIDYVVVLIIIFVPFMIVDVRLSFVYERTDLFILLVMTLLIFKDLVFRNASIGKKAMKLEVKKENNDMPIISTIILRNIFLMLWPIEAILFVFYGKRLGDIVFKTKVVEHVKNNKS